MKHIKNLYFLIGVAWAAPIHSSYAPDWTLIKTTSSDLQHAYCTTRKNYPESLRPHLYGPSRFRALFANQDSKKALLSHEASAQAALQFPEFTQKIKQDLPSLLTQDPFYTPAGCLLPLIMRNNELSASMRFAFLATRKAHTWIEKNRHTAKECVIQLWDSHLDLLATATQLHHHVLTNPDCNPIEYEMHYSNLRRELMLRRELAKYIAKKYHMPLLLAKSRPHERLPQALYMPYPKK